MQENTSIMSSPCLLLGKVARILVFANGGGCAPPRFCHPIHACNKKKHHVITLCAVREGCADHCVFANGGGCAPPNPPAFFKPSTRAIKHKHHVIAVFAVGKGCEDPCVCKWGGGLRPPQPPRFCQPHPKKKKKQKTSCHHHVCSKGRLRGSLRVCIWGGLRPPPIVV